MSIRIRKHLDPRGSIVELVLEGMDQPLVLRDVVAGAAQISVQLRDHRALGRGDVHAEPRVAGVAPAAPVDVDVERVGQGSGTVTGTGGS